MVRSISPTDPTDGWPWRRSAFPGGPVAPSGGGATCGQPTKPRVSPLPVWRLQRVDTYIDEHLADPVRLADLAGAVGLSRMHFAAQFRAATGHRPREHLLVRRIEHAKTILAAQDVSLVEVALTVGFQAQSHFSTVFKRMTGSSPAVWRRHARLLTAANTNSLGNLGRSGLPLSDTTEANAGAPPTDLRGTES